MINQKVSIVMSVFNDEKFLPFAIKSVLKQSLKNLELIIIDDASSDRTSTIISKYLKKDKRVKSFRFNTNQGPPICLNKGLTISSGEYIARIDSDDLWTDKNKLMKQLQVMDKNPKLAFVGTWAKAIDINSRELYNLNYPTSYEEIEQRMLSHNCFLSSSILIRKRILRGIRYGTKERYAQDYGLWLKLGTKGEYMNIPEFMTAYRINPQGISQTKYDGQLKATLNLIREHKNYFPHYNLAVVLWNIRRYYPRWVRGKLSKQIKDKISTLLLLRGKRRQ